MVQPTSLGEFLQVERRLGGAGGGEMADGHFLYSDGEGVTEHETVGTEPLFEDGRVLPPIPLGLMVHGDFVHDGIGGVVASWSNCWITKNLHAHRWKDATKTGSSSGFLLSCTAIILSFLLL